MQQPAGLTNVRLPLVPAVVLGLPVGCGPSTDRTRAPVPSGRWAARARQCPTCGVFSAWSISCRTGGLLGLLLNTLADRSGGAKHAVGELALGVQELGGEVEHRVHDLGRSGQLVGAGHGGLGVPGTSCWMVSAQVRMPSMTASWLLRIPSSTWVWSSWVGSLSVGMDGSSSAG